MATTDPEFTTIADAARLLGVSERTARRHAGRLPDSDRQTPDNAPVRVRLSSLRDRLGMSPSGDNAQDSDQPVAGHVADTAGQGDSLLREIIERQDREIQQHVRDKEHFARLADQAQQLHIATIAELREVKQKAERLESENRRLIEAGHASDSAGQDEETMPPLSQNDAQDSGTGQGEVLIPPMPTEGNSEASRRHWWQFWKPNGGA